MPRAKNRSPRKQNYSVRPAILARNNCYSIAKDTFLRAGVYAYRDRKQNKRNFRSLWIMRINAAARLNGMAYGKFISGLKAKGIELDRKSLAHMALHEPDAFKLLVETVKA